MAFSIATLGSGSAVTKVAKDAGKMAEITAKFKKMLAAAKASPTLQKGIKAWEASEPARDLYKVRAQVQHSSGTVCVYVHTTFIPYRYTYSVQYKNTSVGMHYRLMYTSSYPLVILYIYLMKLSKSDHLGYYEGDL